MSEQSPEGAPSAADRGTGGETRALPFGNNGGQRADGAQAPPATDRLTDTTKLPKVPAERGTVHGELYESMDGYRATGYPQPRYTPAAPPSAGPTAAGGFRPYQPPPQAPRRPDRPGRPSRPVAGTKAAEARTRARVFKGLGLLAIAVVSGLIWYSIRAPEDTPGGGGTSGSIETSVGTYDFARAGGPVADATCSPHAYDDIQRLLRKFPCRGMVRTLYTSTPEPGRTVVTSVSMVRMPTGRAARLLKLRTTQNDTGNVKDLPKEGVTVPGAPPSLSGGGFAATVQGSRVVIVESDFLTVDASQDEDADNRLLVAVSKDALRLGLAVK